MRRYWWVCALVLLGCTTPSVEETALAIPGCQVGETMGTTPEMLEGVLLQSVLVTAEGEEAGYRIFADGRYQSKTINQDWTNGTDLMADQVDQVRTIITEAHFDQLDALYEPTQAGSDRNTLWMQAREAGQLYQVAIVGSCEVPQIQTLSQQLLEIFR